MATTLLDALVDQAAADTSNAALISSDCMRAVCTISESLTGGGAAATVYSLHLSGMNIRTGTLAWVARGICCSCAPHVSVFAAQAAFKPSCALVADGRRTRFASCISRSDHRSAASCTVVRASVHIVGSVFPSDAMARMVLSGWAAHKYGACVAELDRLRAPAQADAERCAFAVCLAAPSCFDQSEC